MGTKFIIATALAASFLGSAAAYAAPLITNGDFNGTYTSNSQFGTAFGGQGVTGWTGGNGYELYFTSAAASSTVNAAGQYSYTGKEKLYGPVAASPSGGSFIGLDGEQSNGVQGIVSQTVNGLISGQSYTLSFDWAAGQVQSRSGNTTEQLKVSLGASSLFTPVVSNVSGGFSGWMAESLTFVASGTSEVLSFLSVGTPAGLPPMALLDNVSLVQQVPEPMSLALLGAGVFGLGMVRRNRKA